MIARRSLLVGLAAAPLIAAPLFARAAEPARVTSEEAAAARAAQLGIDPRFMPRLVRVQSNLIPGTIYVLSRQHFLYLITGKGEAIRYGVAEGKAELVFRGEAVVGKKVEWPSWKPTPEMIARNPGAYAKYADGMPGGPGNPLGARALYLYQDGRDTAIRIHGTIEPSSIGSSVSNGCLRMVNEHVMDLYERVPMGTPVFVY